MAGPQHFDFRFRPEEPEEQMDWESAESDPSQNTSFHKGLFTPFGIGVEHILAPHDIICAPNANSLVLVIDTNILLDEKTSESVLNVRKLPPYRLGLSKLTVVLPYVVFDELDKMKNGPKNSNRAYKSRKGRRAIERQLEDGTNCKVLSTKQQRDVIADAASSLPPSVGGLKEDDMICCSAAALQLFLNNQLPNNANGYHEVVLLTDDENMLIKMGAWEIDGLQAMNMDQFHEVLHNRGITRADIRRIQEQDHYRPRKAASHPYERFPHPQSRRRSSRRGRGGHH